MSKNIQIIFYSLNNLCILFISLFSVVFSIGCVHEKPRVNFPVLYLDMDGSTSDAGKITTKTTFDLTPDFVYLLSFDLAGNQIRNTNETITVQFAGGSVFNEMYTVAMADPLTTFTEIFTVASAISGKLSFEASGNDNVGPLLDNVSLKAIPIPIPAAVIIGVLGLGVAGIKLRKYA